MREPHVESLQYRLETDEKTTYNNPPAVQWETDEFCACLDDGLLEIRMKTHFSSVEEARKHVDGVLRAWEIDVALRRGPGELRFVYEGARVIDRDPAPPGSNRVIPLAGTLTGSGGLKAGPLHAIRGKYPDPPQQFRFTPDVETLWNRYEGYRKGQEPLLAMAYFCLSLVESISGGRPKASKTFNVSKPVLEKIGQITSERGDAATARKIDRKKPQMAPLSDAEAAWVEAAVKALIRRVGEENPNGSTPKTTMSDLPPL